jgi:Mg2+-importing ATPase
VLLKVFHYDERAFHTGWFLESLATQTLVLFVIRTARRPWSNRPSKALAMTTLAVVVVGLVLPYSPLAGTFGLKPLPPVYFAFLAFIVATYLSLVELVKERVMRHVVPTMGETQSPH